MTTAARGDGAAEPEQGRRDGGRQELWRKKRPRNLVTELAGAVLVAPSQPRSGLHNEFRLLMGEKKEKKKAKYARRLHQLPPFHHPLR